MSRRSALGIGVGLLTAALSGCGFGRRRFDAALNDAVQAVDGVTDSALETATGGEFQRVVRGTITVDAEGRSEALEIYGRAMTALATACVDEGSEQSEPNRIVGAVTATTGSGESLDVWDLRPDLKAERGRLDAVTVEDFLPA